MVLSRTKCYSEVNILGTYFFDQFDRYIMARTTIYFHLVHHNSFNFKIQNQVDVTGIIKSSVSLFFMTKVAKKNSWIFIVVQDRITT